MSSLYNQHFTAETIGGGSVNLDDFYGKVLLIVNTTSKCGFTPQFDGLESMYQRYKDDGLVILGFPCNQFAKQDPGTNSEIAEECRLNYGVSFPMMAKIDVNGDNAHPLYDFLKKEQSGILTKDIKWNFTKFLISRDGTVLERFAPQTEPSKFEDQVREALGV